MSHRRKPFDIEMKRNQYIAHIKKLVELKSNNNSYLKSVAKQRQQIDELIKQSHKMHDSSFKMELKNRENKELLTQRSNYKSIKSIVKGELERKILTVPDKHKADNYFRDLANLKLVDKILNAKSQFNFKKELAQKNQSARSTKIKKIDNEDFSQIYKKSIVRPIKPKKIHLRLDKTKDRKRIGVKFLNNQTLFLGKSSNQFSVCIECDEKQKASKYFLLDDIIGSELVLDIPQKDCAIYLVERMCERNIPRYKILLKEDELKEKNNIWISKVIEDLRNNIIGIVQIEVKKRRQKKMIVDEKEEHLITQKQNKQETQSEKQRVVQSVK